MQGRGLSAETIAQARGVLSSALQQAEEEGLVATNPVTALKRPRIHDADSTGYAREQLLALLEDSSGTIWEVPILLSAVTGGRRSEILGLAWQDLDLGSGRSACAAVSNGRQGATRAARSRSRRSRPSGLAEWSCGPNSRSSASRSSPRAQAV
jgi:integrase